MFSKINRGFNSFRAMAGHLGLRAGSGLTQAAFKVGGQRAGMAVGSAVSSAAIWSARNPRAATALAVGSAPLWVPGGMTAIGAGAGALWKKRKQDRARGIY
jgi:hypothetical protein